MSEEAAMVHEIRLSISFSERFARGVLTAGLLLAPLELGSETMSLTTQYPSPSGIYNSIVTVGLNNTSTILARNGGNVGIGTASPQQKLDVAGAVRFGNTGAEGGRISAFGPNGFGGRTASLSVGDGRGGPLDEVVVGPAAGYAQGHARLLAADIKLDDGVAVAQESGGVFTVNNLSANGYFHAAPGACSAVSGAGGSCGPGQYITWVGGIYAEGAWYQNIPDVESTNVNPDASFISSFSPTYYCCNQ